MQLGAKLAGACLGAAVAFVAVGHAEAQDRIRWKMQSAFAGSLVGIGSAGVQYSKVIEKLSDGRIDIKFFDPGALVPALQAFDAVSQGSIEAAWNSAGYFAGKEPAGAFFTAVPFGPQVQEYLAWLREGGGWTMQKELYGKYGVWPKSCNYIEPESSGWFRKEIKSLDDLKGLKMRFFGLGARVMEKMGVSTQLLAAGDIYPALELGTIDATEFSNPAIDLNLGFHQVAKHYYFPGWHQQATLVEIQINMAKFNGASESDRYKIEIACDAVLADTIGKSPAAQAPALKAIAAKGVTLHHWPPEVLAKLEATWNEVLKEESAANANFKRVAENYLAFRENFKAWRELGYMR